MRIVLKARNGYAPRSSSFLKCQSAHQHLSTLASSTAKSIVYKGRDQGRHHVLTPDLCSWTLLKQGEQPPLLRSQLPLGVYQLWLPAETLQQTLPPFLFEFSCATGWHNTWGRGSWSVVMISNTRWHMWRWERSSQVKVIITMLSMLNAKFWRWWPVVEG